MSGALALRDGMHGSGCPEAELSVSGSAGKQQLTETGEQCISGRLANVRQPRSTLFILSLTLTLLGTVAFVSIFYAVPDEYAFRTCTERLAHVS